MIPDKHHIIVKTRKKLFLDTLGEHLSIFNGNGLQFSEIREYNIDDDVRHINWKITAKTQSPSVNVFNEEKQINVVLAYLNSGSLYFGTKRAKKDAAVEILTSLSYTVINKKDTLTSIFFDRDERFFYKPTKDKSIVDINYDTGVKLEPLGLEIDYEKLYSYLMNKIKKRSIIFLIGDFLQMPKIEALGNKHELYCVIVRDKGEEDLKLLGEFELVSTDSNLKENLTLDKSSIKTYNEKMRRYDKELFSYLKSHNVKFEKIYSDDDVYEKLYHLISRG